MGLNLPLRALVRWPLVRGLPVRMLWAAMAWFCALAPVQAGGGALSIVDDAGVTVVLPAVPVRIVSLLPSLTETVCVLGACDRLVGVDRWSNWPARVLGLPRLGGLDEVSIERVVALRPDLVLLAPSSRVTPRLRQLGVKVAELDARDLPEVERLLRKTAALLGRPEVGPAHWQQMQTALEAIARTVPARSRGATVYVEISAAPHAAGAGSYIGQLLSQQGARNIVPASLGPFPKLNPEYVVRARPELIVVAATEVEAMRRRPGWSTIPAVRQGRLCALGAEEMDAMSRPGPRLPEAARALARCLASFPGASR